MELVKPQKPPYAEKHYRGQPSPTQLELILRYHGKELFEQHELCQGEKRKLAADLMAPTASEAQVKLREAAWAKRDDVWAKYRRACRKYEEALSEAMTGPAQKRQRRTPELVREAEAEKGKEKELKAKELREAHDQMQLAYDADPQGAICRFTKKMDELSKEPASDAIALNGLCACSGSHAVVKSLGVIVAVAAEKYWRAHPVSATHEPRNVPKLLREVFQRVPDLNGADSVSSIMMLRFDGVEVAPLRRSRRETRRFPDGSIPRRRRNGRGPVGSARVGGVFVYRSGAAAGARVRRGTGPQ